MSLSPGAQKQQLFVNINDYLTRKVGLLLFYLLRDRKVTNSIFVNFCQILSRLTNRTKCQHYVLFMPKFVKVDQMVGIYRLGPKKRFGHKQNVMLTKRLELTKIEFVTSLSL